MMNLYLLDSNAVVDYLCRHPRYARIVEFLIEQRSVFRQATLFLPNFCIAEVFNTLAKLHFDESSPHRLTPEGYRSLLERFRQQIHWAQVFYPYELNRYHILAADETIPWEQQLPRKEKPSRPGKLPRLSTYDILYVAMGMELAYLFGRQNVTLITNDSRIKNVVEELELSRRPEREAKRVPRKLGEPDISRWPVPNIFHLGSDSTSVLPCAERQKPLNLSAH